MCRPFFGLRIKLADLRSNLKRIVVEALRGRDLDREAFIDTWTR